MDTQTFGAPLSGLPPLAYLSGLNLGQGGLSGAQDQSLSGSGATQRGLVPGMAGGPGLDELSQLLATAGGGDTGVGAVGSTPFSLQALAQQPTQTGGYAVAGQSAAPGGSAAQGAAAGSADPLAILQKILGIGAKAAGALGQGGGGSPYGTAGGGTGGSGTSGFETGIASPFVGIGGDINAQGVPPGAGFQDQNIAGQTGGYSSGLTPDMFLVNKAGPGVTPSSIQQVYDAALASGMTNDQILQALNTPGGLEQLSQLVPGQGFEQTTIGGSGAPGYATAGQSSLSGTLGGGAQAGLGLLNLLQGLQGGNVQGSVGGGLQGIGGLAQILQSNPQLAQALGITPEMLSSLGPALGGAGGLLGLATGAQGLASGNAGQIGAALPQLLGGGLSTYQALQSLLGQGGGAGGLAGGLGTLGSSIFGLIGSGDPYGGGSAAGSLGGLAAGPLAATAQGTSSLAPLAGAISGPLAGVAPIIGAIISYIGAMEEKNARESGWANNPIAGGLNAAATSGVGQGLGLLDQIQQGGGYGKVPTEQLLTDLPQLVNDLGPYFSTAQGPKGPIRASTALTGMFGRPGLGGTEQYTANEQRAQQGVMDLVNELMGRGVTYEQLGQLPVSNAFTNSTMDMYNPLQDFYGANAAKYNQAAQPLLQSITQANRQMLDPQEAMRMAAAGQNPASFGYTQDASGNWYSAPRIATGNPNGDFVELQGGQLTPDLLFKAAQGATASGAPDSATKAGGLVSSMYGGPLWAALARMGSPFQSLIQQHFNPWATIGGYNPQQLTGSLQPLLNPMLQGGQTGVYDAIGSTPGEATGGI